MSSDGYIESITYSQRGANGSQYDVRHFEPLAVVDARYIKSLIYPGNPFVEALPPVPSEDELIRSSTKSFDFKTFSSSCSDFNVSGSIAYNKEKSSIYINNINYCGGDDETEYKEIQCNLYESNNNSNIKISSCQSDKGNIKLEDYLNNVELNIDDYKQACSKYNDNSLYLEINATREDNKVITYKIPLKLNENCSK